MFVVMAMVVLRYILSIQVIVLEDKGVFAGMTRSSTLSAGSRFKLFLLFVAIFIMSLIVSYAFSWLARTIVPVPDISSLDSLEEMQRAFTHTVMIQNLIALVGEILITPVGAAALILFYYDLRIRKEGFDLEMLAEAIGEQAPETETASDAGFPEA